MDKFRMAISGASEEQMKISKPNHHNEPPMFKIRDSMDEELALWVGEDYRTAQKEYRNAQEEFGFNKDTFVPVHETWLRYYPFDNGGIFMITALDPYEKPKRNRKSLREKILENIPNFQTLVPQPSH